MGTKAEEEPLIVSMVAHEEVALCHLCDCLALILMHAAHVCIKQCSLLASCVCILACML